MRISVIIPAYNDIAAVMVCLNSLQAMQSGAVDVAYHVQDDASPGVFFPALISQRVATCARNPVNLGFAGNVNAGIERTDGDLCFLVNQDVFAVPTWSQGWDAALARAFAEHPDAGLVGARLLFDNGNVQNAGGVIDALGQPVHRCLGWSNPNVPEVATAGEVAWSTGAALAVRRAVWQHLGGFDTAFGRGYFEDADFCLRARERGWRTWYEPGVTLIHTVGTTGGNPAFFDNARLFKSRWIDSGKVKPGAEPIRVRYW